MKYSLYKAALEKLAEDICLSVELKKTALEKLAQFIPRTEMDRKLLEAARTHLKSELKTKPFIPRTEMDRKLLQLARTQAKSELSKLPARGLSSKGKALLALALVPAIGGAGYGAYTLGRRRKSRKRR